MGIIKYFNHIKSRRNVLRGYFKIDKGLSLLDESCVPSYCHKNSILSWVAWWRLIKADGLLRKFKPEVNVVLDFGAGSGELFYLINKPVEYDFVESNNILKYFINTQIPLAKEVKLDEQKRDSYDVILALDSLEHNKEPEGIIIKLVSSLKPGGLFILSGPTENLIYKIGRRFAGFRGGYHSVTVYELEKTFRKYLINKITVSGPLFLPIFRISAWIKK